MAISEEDYALIQNSFATLRQSMDAHSTFFYEALFARAPEMREMFRDDLAGQSMKFMTTLGVILEKLRNEAEVAEQYKNLGASHAVLGIRAKDFEPMGEALIDTVRHALQEDFTPELEQAWRGAYRAVSANMIKRGGIKTD